MPRLNLINGSKPEFGNPDHIKYVKEHNEIFNGIRSLHQIDWAFAQYIGETGETGKPRFTYCGHRKADCVVDYIPCPRCHHQHILLITFSDRRFSYQTMLEVQQEAQEFECWNCRLKFISDEEGFVYCKPPQNVAC
jgi:hypothetical protein